LILWYNLLINYRRLKMTDNLNDKSLKAPLPVSTGKPEITDGTNWFTLATENWVMNREGLTPALAATSANGTNGVGATLTNSGTQSTLVIDGVTLAAGNRVLVKNQTTGLQNGIYTVTNIGSASTNWILTRATDFDSTSQMDRGKTIDVISGTTNAVTSWMLTSVVATVGTDSITFAKLAQSGIANILGTTAQIIVTIANGVATIRFDSNPVLPGTASVTIPTGTTVQRPSTLTAGMLRFNTSLT
jgi:hypothetical protein